MENNINNMIEKLLEEHKNIEYKILENILPKEKINDLYIEGFIMDYLYGTIWIIDKNTIYYGDEFDIKDYVNTGEKINISEINITYIKKIDNLTYAIEEDEDFYTIYIFDNYYKYDDTFNDRQQKKLD